VSRIAAVAACVIVAAGCGTATTSAQHAKPVTLNVYAASSLKGAFAELGKTFEASHPGTRVVLTFGGSSDLVAQIQQGAPADVFASADEKNMEKLATDKLIAGVRPFASNTLEIAVPAGNPAHVTRLKDLGSPDVDVVVCARQVPCGSAAAKVADAAHLKLHAVSEEQSVADVLNKVMSGQADAGLVYVTDVKAAGDKVKGISFPEAKDAVNVYPIAAMSSSRHASRARAFVDLILGNGGQNVLRDAGFAKP
jgi:molybdate transport system substrate-binding protein